MIKEIPFLFSTLTNEIFFLKADLIKLKKQTNEYR